MKLKIFLAICLLPLGPMRPAFGAANGPALDFKEVYDLLRANLGGADEAELNRAAAQGLIAQLNPRVTLLGDSLKTGTTATNSSIQTAVFDGSYGYLRVARVEAGSEKQFSEAIRRLAATNKLKGVVFDLRYAVGDDYAASAAIADLFFASERPLMDWGNGMKKSTGRTDPISLPMALLVNGQTAGAAEALAGILRQADVALLIGSNTAGRASIAREFALKNGQRLRIATTPVKMGNGQPFPLTGLKPDIQVQVAAEDERAYFDDAYKMLPKSGLLPGTASDANPTSSASTNRAPRRRINEAELVRMLREGETQELEAALAPRPIDPARPLVNDPALARAIDLLKGLAVVQQFRSI